MGRINKIILAILILFLIFSLTRNIFTYQKTQSFYDGFKKEYEREKQKNIELKTQILKKKDPNEVEKTIRNKLNLLKPGEIAIILPEPTSTPSPITSPPKPPYRQWLELFFSL